VTPLRVGSLCTGIAGLEHGLDLAGLDTKTVFVSDIDEGASTWLEANIAAPNLGDFTALEELPPVDLLTAGFPCQPLSIAGKRLGVEDERWLFDDIARLVSRMESRPLVFLENVPGLLTANDGHAMARVVHGLAGIGYSITWGTLAAAEIGAAHRRNRFWGLAWYTDGAPSNARASESTSRHTASQPDSGATNPSNVGYERAGDTRPGWPRSSDRNTGTAAEQDRRLGYFGRYAEAIARWEHVMGRAAPEPKLDGKLSAAFTEWLMGYPEGWVTNTLTNRRHALHALGNAVVPQCAAAAFTALLARVNDQAAGGTDQTPAA